MTDYVEREAVLREIKEFAEEFCECDYVFPPMVRDIKRLPAADVRPVVRGNWEEWWPSELCLIFTGEEMLWMCSECAAKFSERKNFCSNCGADMREEQ